MYLRDISVGASESAVMPRGKTVRDFNRSTHHVQEIFLALMPERYSVDGTGKINIDIGPRGDEDQYVRLLDVSVYHYEDFDFHNYFLSDANARSEMILEVLERSLLAIAKRFKASTGPIRSAAKGTRSSSFQLTSFLPKLSKSTPSRALSLNVFRRIGADGENWGIEVRDRSGTLLKTLSIAKRIRYVKSRMSYRKSRWTAKGFEILDGLGNVTYRYDAAMLFKLERQVAKVSSARG